MTRKPKLYLQVRTDHTITLNSTTIGSDTHLRGQVTFSNVPPQCDTRITLVRVGHLRRGKETKIDTASKSFMRELGLLGSQKEQARESFNYETAEKLCGCSMRSPQGLTGSKESSSYFELPIPSHLPATAALPLVDISYAISARCVLPNGHVLQAQQTLRISREKAEVIHLEASRTVSFPDTTFAMRANFATPEVESKAIRIPIILRLHGLQLPMNNLMRATETRWLVPREIKWGIEETAVIVTGYPDSTGHIPMSTVQRVLDKRKLASGSEKLKLKYPFTRHGNTHIRVLSDNTGMDVPFHVTVPRTTSLGDTTALSVAGSHVLHTVLAYDSHLASNLPQQRFAVYLEYKLHIWSRMGEDVFDKASGDLVNRKMDEMAYTLVCPLRTLHCDDTQSTDADEEPAPVIPPSYDMAWEQSPPEYTSYS